MNQSAVDEVHLYFVSKFVAKKHDYWFKCWRSNEQSIHCFCTC